MSLGIGADDELMLHFVRHFRAVQDGVGIAENAGNGCFQFVGDVLCQFAAHAVLLLGLLATDALVHSLGIAEQ